MDPSHANAEALEGSGGLLPNMQTLLHRPFQDVLKEIESSLKLRSTASQASEQLRFLLKAGGDAHAATLLASSVPAVLVRLVAEGPGLPASGSAMHAMSMLALSSDGRTRLRCEGALLPVVKYLQQPAVLQKPNAEPALLLLQNAACDSLCRRLLRKADAIELLLGLLRQNCPGRQHSELSASIAGALCNMIVEDCSSGSSSSSSSGAKQRFARAGGNEMLRRALAECGGRGKSSAAMRQRLKLLQSCVSGNLLQMKEDAQGGVASAQNSYRLGFAGAGTPGRSAPLGSSPRRIMAEVLKHGAPAEGEQQEVMSSRPN